MGKRCPTLGCIGTATNEHYPCKRCYEGKGPRTAPKTCAECGGAMPSYSFGMPRRYCKDACTRRARKRVIRCLKRAQRHGAAVLDHVNPMLVFIRDGWRCMLCGTRTPRKLLGTNDPGAPCMDHRVALVLGGEHSYANTQCLCRTCNRIKAMKEQVTNA